MFAWAGDKGDLPRDIPMDSHSCHRLVGQVPATHRRVTFASLARRSSAGQALSPLCFPTEDKSRHSMHLGCPAFTAAISSSDLTLPCLPRALPRESTHKRNLCGIRLYLGGNTFADCVRR